MKHDSTATKIISPMSTRRRMPVPRRAASKPAARDPRELIRVICDTLRALSQTIESVDVAEDDNGALFWTMAPWIRILLSMPERSPEDIATFSEIADDLEPPTGAGFSLLLAAQRAAARHVLAEQDRQVAEATAARAANPPKPECPSWRDSARCKNGPHGGPCLDCALRNVQWVPGCGRRPKGAPPPRSRDITRARAYVVQAHESEREEAIRRAVRCFRLTDAQAKTLGSEPRQAAA